jgi:uncharacterized membrane protein
MQEKLFLLGLAFILIGVLIVIVASFLGGKKVEYAFGGFIGPIPFGWASNEKMLIILLILLFLFSLFIFFLR